MLVFVCVLLVCSTVLNVIALLPSVAFLELKGLLLPGPYSILKVIHLLWDHHLYPLVVLVIGFSVLFPPVKIALAAMSLMRPMTRAGRFRLLNTLGHLGRWSLLDVFVALLLLIITAKQSFTGSTVSFGLYAFVGAIVLSMTAVSILQEYSRPVEFRPNATTPLLIRGGIAGWLTTPVVLAAGVCLVNAVTLPLFKVDKFGLMSNSWSLYDAIAQFQSQGLELFAGVMAVFLIVMPTLLAIGLITVLAAHVHAKAEVVIHRVVHHIYEWCMLDVFLLAMVLYLTEEGSFAPLNLKAGFTHLIGAMALFHVAGILLYQAQRRADRRG